MHSDDDEPFGRGCSWDGIETAAVTSIDNDD